MAGRSWGQKTIKKMEQDWNKRKSCKAASNIKISPNPKINCCTSLL